MRAGLGNLNKAVRPLHVRLACLHDLAAGNAAQPRSARRSLARTLCATRRRVAAALAREQGPFRTLSRKYPIDELTESLAEGPSVGHPDMPEFFLESDDITAILAYLNSIQEQ